MRGNVAEHFVRNRAGTALSFTTHCYDRYAAYAVSSCTRFFIRTDAYAGVKSWPIRQHGTTRHDISLRCKSALVALPRAHPIWEHAIEDFTSYTMFPRIVRPPVFNNEGVRTEDLHAIPEHLKSSIVHYTSFGSTAASDEEAALLKLGLI